MADQIYIGNFAKGLKLDRLPFNINNDAFPTLLNFYIWRGRAKRKRGTQFLGQLTRQLSLSLTPLPWQLLGFPLVAGSGNLITSGTYTLETTSNIDPGSLALIINGNTYTDPNEDGTLFENAVLNPGSSINYATGVIVISGGGVSNVTGTFSYFPGLPVMGLQDFVSNTSTRYPLLLAFDTKYSYQVNQVGTFAFFYSTSYYKTTNNPIVWSGFDYQQFWTTNYSGALWATNNKPGLHFLNAIYVSGSGTNIITFNFKSLGTNFTTLIVGDILWFNEWQVTTASITAATQTNPVVLTAANTFIMGQQITISGVEGMTQLNAGIFTITAVTPTTITLNVDGTDFGDFISGGNPTATLKVVNTINGENGTVSANLTGGNYQVTFLAPQTVSGIGIVQMLTTGLPGQDGIRWYDGDPTAATGLPTMVPQLFGWVNFSPPLTALDVSIDNFDSRKYYLVGALAILPFKDRLLFFSPYIQTAGGSPIQLQDTVLWSWNGTPYYNNLLPGYSAGTEVFDITAYYVDQTGKGGYLPAGIDEPMQTFVSNEDVILIGFGGDGQKTRFVYTGNDLQPFLFFNINSELPSTATFSAINFDKGALDIGQYGLAMTDQQSSQRIDLDIPDVIFEIRASDHGAERVNAVRDFFKEWVYFSMPIFNSYWIYPTQTLLFNYRDNTWAIFYENFTKHGLYRPTRKKSWLNTGFSSWEVWREPWNSTSLSPQFPAVVAGNPQGYVLIKGEGTGEGISGTITSITDNAGFAQINSINHCVNVGDYLYFSGILGLLTSTITAITLGNTTILTSTNTFSLGQNVTISNIVGTTQLNGNTYPIIGISGADITIDVNSTSFTPYISGGNATSAFNGIIGRVSSVLNSMTFLPDPNNFTVDIPTPVFITAYLGLGKFTRLSRPLIQTKQFPMYWEIGRKVRLCAQKYLMDFTTASQVTVNIYLSQDPSNVYNDPVINVPPNSLIYSQLMYTCPESTNIGLTPANINLQMPTAANQSQIWHRFNTSLQGDSVQIGITLSDLQMRNLTYATDEITLHGLQLTTEVGPILC